MNQTAKELREAADYMKREGVDLLGAVIRLNNTFDAINPGAPAANLGAIVAYIADELDELDDKAARRRSHIVKLESAIAERNRELRELRKQVPTDREREILDMWPRFEDSEYVWFGDEVACRGKACMLDDVKFVSDGTFHDETYLYVSNGLDVFEVPIAAGERVKRPARSVLDADGVEIHVGDTVWHHSGFAHGVVTSIDAGSLMGTVRYVNGGVEFRDAAKDLTHTRPDSWERLEEDAEKLACAYLGRSEGTCFGCPLENCKDFAACSKEQAKDIVRRAKALAGVEVD